MQTSGALAAQGRVPHIDSAEASSDSTLVSFHVRAALFLVRGEGRSRSRPASCRVTRPVTPAPPTRSSWHWRDGVPRSRRRPRFCASREIGVLFYSHTKG